MKSARPYREQQGGLRLAVLLVLAAWGAFGAETNSLPANAVPPPVTGAVIRLESNAAPGTETSSIPAKGTPAIADEQALRSHLEVQAKLHSTLLAIEQARQEAGAASASNASLLAERLRQLESAMAAQRAREREMADESNRTLLIAAGGFAGLGVLALGLVIYFQMRGMTRLAEIATALPTARMLGGGHGLPELGAGDSLRLLAAPHGSGDTDSARLLGVVDRLERRIQELEQTAQASPVAASRKSAKPVGSEMAARMAELLDRAKALEKSKRHAEALALCDEALAIDPTLTPAWLVKAAQLQALGREKEALRCYESVLQRLDGGNRAGH